MFVHFPFPRIPVYAFLVFEKKEQEEKHDKVVAMWIQSMSLWLWEILFLRWFIHVENKLTCTTLHRNRMLLRYSYFPICNILFMLYFSFPRKTSVNWPLHLFEKKNNITILAYNKGKCTCLLDLSWPLSREDSSGESNPNPNLQLAYW